MILHRKQKHCRGSGSIGPKGAVWNDGVPKVKEKKRKKAQVVIDIRLHFLYFFYEERKENDRRVFFAFPYVFEFCFHCLVNKSKRLPDTVE